MKTMHKLLLAGCFAAFITTAWATPSTQIWIPSTDIQPYGDMHLGLDNYFRASDHGYLTPGTRDPNVFDGGLTIGVLPFDLIQMEVGADYVSYGNAYDANPYYFNAKLGIPEGGLFTNAPALAIGGYNFGTNSKKDSLVRTDQNIVYGLVAKTLPEFWGLPSLGRFSGGWYVGNGDVLVGTDGKKENQGVLLSWDRTMSEISDKLWAAVDYQGGDNSVGGLSFGIAWAFTPKVSLLFGYDIWNQHSLAGANTFTTQLDINL
jgi:hypothetical protein